MKHKHRCEKLKEAGTTFKLSIYIKLAIYLLLSAIITTPSIGDTNIKRGWSSIIIKNYKENCQKGYIHSTLKNYKEQGYDPDAITKEELADLESYAKYICGCITILAQQSFEYSDFENNINKYVPLLAEKIKNGVCPIPVPG